MPKRRSAAVSGRGGGGGGFVGGVGGGGSAAVGSGGVAGAILDEPAGGDVAEIVGGGEIPPLLDEDAAAPDAMVGSPAGEPAAPTGGSGTAGSGTGGTAIPSPESMPRQDREVVFRDGYAGRLGYPLQRSDGEVRRFNDLWGRYDRGDELTPEERGELYEYLRRRMILPARRLDQASRAGDSGEAREAARSFAFRYGQLERFVDSELPVSGQEALEPYRDRVPLALSLVSGEVGIAAPDLASVSTGALNEAVAFQVRDLGRTRADLMGLAASADDFRAVTPKYAELERRLAAARETAAEYERRGERVPPELEREIRLAERWSQSARETSDVLRSRAGRLNFTNDERRNGFTVSRRAVSLPEPPPREVLASPEMRGAASRIFFSVPRRGRTTDLTRHLRRMGIPYAASAEAPPGTAVHINWGSGGTFGEGVANRDTSGATDKVEMLRRLGELAPRSTFDVREAERLFGSRVVAKMASGSRGEGKEVVDLGTDEGRRRAYAYDFFQEFIPERDEYRVTLFGDEVLTAHRKNAVPGSNQEDLAPERVYERARRLPREAVEAAKEARRRCGLDLAGVDLVRDRRDGRWYVLEVNAAPGMGEETLARLVQVVAGRLADQNQERVIESA
ncbi:hypothetical protein MTAT_26520 [Moorella thermoacetica]|uniref:Ribosomal protein S6 modification protein n=1 Tax=Neomoorella thermoacetica TaxID=1525 RepID=A0AAC9HFX9_NEOTH|nr:hypothetical protein [Moorella thermoacetica]AOQ23045.1 ribosomal protein S6 modification protein [Moorella thermoacetica]TYL08988.1 hypothetical protein MTAT_26520 [Moorella thermoacetica]